GPASDCNLGSQKSGLFCHLDWQFTHVTLYGAPFRKAILAAALWSLGRLPNLTFLADVPSSFTISMVTPVRVRPMSEASLLASSRDPFPIFTMQRLFGTLRTRPKIVL